MAPSAGETGSFLHIDHLTKSYGRVKALDRVSFAIRRGEILGVIGPNGSGKTTLFACLGAVRPSDAGSVRNEGRDIPVDQRHALMLYIPDGIVPWPAQRVRWVLDYAIGYYGGRPDHLPSIVQGLDLAPFLDLPMGALSKGQRKRALLAVGLLAPQPLLMIDEPFDGLDLRQTRELARTLRACASTGRTLLLSIHQLSDAARVCDRFVLLSAGRVVGEGTREELASVAAARGVDAGTDLEEVFLALT